MSLDIDIQARGTRGPLGRAARPAPGSDQEPEFVLRATTALDLTETSSVAMVNSSINWRNWSL